MTINELLEPAKQNMTENAEKYALPYDQMLKFLEEAQVTNDHLKTARKYTTNIDSLIESLNNIYQHVEYRTIKYKLTQLKNQLYDQMAKEKEENESQSESDEDEEY